MTKLDNINRVPPSGKPHSPASIPTLGIQASPIFPEPADKKESTESPKASTVLSGGERSQFGKSSQNLAFGYKSLKKI